MTGPWAGHGTAGSRQEHVRYAAEAGRGLRGSAAERRRGHVPGRHPAVIREDTVVDQPGPRPVLASTNGGGDTPIGAGRVAPTGSGSSVAETSRLAVAP